MNKLVIYLVAVLLIIMAFLSGYTGFLIAPTQPVEPGEIKTFNVSEGSVCYEDGKPVIRMYSTSWCPHCTWVGPTYDRVVKEYVDAGKIVAYHWELDTGDNTLTEAVESEVPKSEVDIFTEFNPKNTIPTFVFGCKYYRIGTGYEKTQDLLAEESEFRAVIDALLD